MDKLAITREPIRKSARIGNKCEENRGVDASFPLHVGITSLPAEMVYEILSYLTCKELRVLRKVSPYFERFASDPFIRRVYKVPNQKMESTAEVIDELKRMPLLNKIRLNSRSDCDDILRQLSLTNRNLEELNIYNCTGSTAKLYLKPGYLIRILQRCHNLHTINIPDSRFRGRKFYRLLGTAGPRLRFVYVQATKIQFRTFIKHSSQISESDRTRISSTVDTVKNWMPLCYFTTKPSDDVRRALIGYLHQDVVVINSNRSTCSPTVD